MKPSVNGLATVLLALVLALGLQAVQGDTQVLWKEEEQRFRVGLKLFPACLGAVESLEEKRLPDGRLRILVVYQGTQAVARQAAESLRELAKIRGFPLSVEVVSAAVLDENETDTVSGIFVASVGVGSKRFRNWSENHRALVFSPFAGDVEKGAVSGLYVTDRILPFINRAQARCANIRFKPFFLQVARQYE